MTKTIKELLDEYGEIYQFWDKERQSYANPLHIEPGLERMSQITSEVEALVRRDTIEDILNNVIKTVWEEDETAETIKQIKEYAKTKDITL